jgi:hypothetical protein
MNKLSLERQKMILSLLVEDSSIRSIERITGVHSKKLENLKSVVALHLFHYNFMKIHKTVQCTPANWSKNYEQNLELG